MRVCCFIFTCSTIRNMFVMAAKDVSKKELQNISERLEKRMEKWRSKDLARDQRRHAESTEQMDSSGDVEDDPGSPSAKKRKTDGANHGDNITDADPRCSEPSKTQQGNRKCAKIQTQAQLSSDIPPEIGNSKISTRVKQVPSKCTPIEVQPIATITRDVDVSATPNREAVGLDVNIHTSHKPDHSNDNLDGQDEICDISVDIDKKGRCNFDVLSSGNNLIPTQTLRGVQIRNIRSKTPGLNGNSSTDINSKTHATDTIGKDETGVKSSDKGKDTNGRRPRIDGQMPTDGQCFPVPDIPDPSMIVALDCEFVGLGRKGCISSLGRCSIIDFYGKVICDVYAKPEATITDYRTPYSGLTERNMRSAIPLKCAIKQIARIISGKVVVGHSVDGDFKVLQIPHPASHIRDTARHKPLQHLMNKDNPELKIVTRRSLKILTDKLLGRKIQVGPHCSVEDATATMDLYKLMWHTWEEDLRQTSGSRYLIGAETSQSDRTCADQNGQRNSVPDNHFMHDKFWPNGFEN